MIKEIDLIKIEVLLKLQLKLIEETNKNENETLIALELIKNMSEEIIKDITVLLNQNSENEK